MKPLLILSILLYSVQVHSQDSEIIKIVFQDKSNFEITTKLQNKMPEKLYVLNITDKWNEHRFHLDENVKSDSVRKALSRSEHHWYNNSYIFKNEDMNSLFNDNEKDHLYHLTQTTQPRKLATGFGVFQLTESFETVKKGFFFSVTDPILSADKQYAFIDITTYKKDEETTELRETYFGMTLLIYQNVEGKGWTRIKKFDYLIL